MNAELRESAVELCFIEGFNCYDSLNDEQLRKFLNTKSVETTTSMTMQSLDDFVSLELIMDMKYCDAKSRIQGLFITYNAILKRNGLSWVKETNPKLSLQHVCEAVKSQSLLHRLKNDLSFSHHHQKKNFKGFLSHAWEVSDPFQKLDPCFSSRNVSGTNSNKKFNKSGGYNG